MADITMSLDDTLELDAIIEKSTLVTEKTTVKGGVEGTDFDLDGIQTHTSIFNPTNSGTYDIKVNGQKLTIKVTDSITIPDSQNLYAYYNPEKQSNATPFVDQTGTTSDLTANGDPTIQSNVFGSKNGIDLDGDGDYYEATSSDWGSISQPFTVYQVFQNDSGTGTDEKPLLSNEVDTDKSNNFHIRWDGRGGKNDWKMEGPNQYTFGSNTPFYNNIVSVWNDTDSLVEADGSVVVSGADQTGVTFDGLRLGYRTGLGGLEWDGRLGIQLVYNTAHDSTTRSEVRTYLSDNGWI